MAYLHRPRAARCRCVTSTGMLVVSLLVALSGCHRAAHRAELADARLRERAWRMQVMSDSVAAVLARGTADSAFPAAYAVVGRRDGVWAQHGINATDSTIWDVASLTKVVGTTSAVLQLVAEGRVQLDAPARTYLPRWTDDRVQQITVRHLLTHTAGLPAWRPLYQDALTAEEALSMVYATAPDTAPGLRYLYSDIGFILLGELVREQTGMPLDSYLLARVFLPLDMRETRFLPSALWLSRTAPTEIDTAWRYRTLVGEVHDENAFRLGMVSGHAGLFSSARDMTRFALALLHAGWPLSETPAPRRAAAPPPFAPTAVLDGPTLRAFAQRQPLANAHRALGWETPNGTNSAGTQLSPGAFGHTGFTGTSLWVDPEQDLFVLLLTNRVHPTRQRQGIGPVRQALANAAVGALRATGALPPVNPSGNPSRSSPGPAAGSPGNLE